MITIVVVVLAINQSWLCCNDEPIGTKLFLCHIIFCANSLATARTVDLAPLVPQHQNSVGAGGALTSLSCSTFRVAIQMGFKLWIEHRVNRGWPGPTS